MRIGWMLVGAWVATIAHGQQASGGVFLDAQAAIRSAVGLDYEELLGLAVDSNGHFYVSARRAFGGDQHRVFELDPRGQFVASYVQPPAAQESIWGLRDGEFDPSTNRIYWGSDLRGSPAVNVHVFDVATRRFLPGAAIRARVTTSVLRGLAIDDGGALWCSNFAQTISQFDVGGIQQSTIPSASSGTYGLAWDSIRGTLWLSSQSGPFNLPSRPGPGVHLIEVDPLTGLETGQSFTLDHLMALVGRGVAGGVDIRQVGDRQVVSVLVDAEPSDGILQAELHDDFGAGCGLELRYVGGAPFGGNGAFGFEVSGLAGGAPAAFLLGIDAAVAPIPGVLSCDVLQIVIDARLETAAGDRATLSLPLPTGIPLGAISCQAVEFTLPFPMRASGVRWVTIVPG